MEHKCPSCDREFEGILDYPRVYVAKFERLSMPSELVLPDFDMEIFVGPNSECGNRRPPEGVLSYFRNNKRVEKFEYDGFIWTIDGKWDSGRYYRSRKDAKGAIVQQLTPYFEKLEGLVGKEVLTSQVLPSFGETRYNHCRIPETSYELSLAALDGKWATQILQQENLPIPRLETPQPTRKLAFVITQCDGGSISEVHNLAVVGGLAYEGRLKK